MKYLKKFNENINKSVLAICQECLVEQLDNGFTVTIEKTDNNEDYISFGRDLEDIWFEWVEVKDDINKLVTILADEYEIFKIVIGQGGSPSFITNVKDLPTIKVYSSLYFVTIFFRN